MAMSVVYATINGQIVSENRGGVISYYAPDNLGSTVALLDTTGTVTDTFTYWPYGEIQSHVGSSVTPFTFCGTLGYYTDVLGSQIYVRARYLRQALARWQTVDRLWPWQRTYAYVSSSPISYVDPTGGQAIAGGIGGGASAVVNCIQEWKKAHPGSSLEKMHDACEGCCRSLFAGITGCALGGALAGAEAGPPGVIIGGAVAAGLGWEAGNLACSKICDQLVQANDAHAICMKDAKSRGGPCSGGNPLDQEQCAERFGKGRGM